MTGELENKNGLCPTCGGLRQLKALHSEVSVVAYAEAETV
jgi:hypothetical protein